MPDLNNLYRKDQLASTDKYHRKQQRMAEPLRERGKGSPIVTLSDAEWEKLLEAHPPIDRLGL